MLDRYKGKVIKNNLLTGKPKTHANFEILNNEVPTTCYQQSFTVNGIDFTAKRTKTHISPKW